MDNLLKIGIIILLPVLHKGQPIIDIHQAIDLGIKHSRDLGIIQKELKIKQRELTFFNSTLKPRIQIGGSLPNFTRTVAPIILPDGNEVFVYRSLTFSRIGIESTWETNRFGTVTLQSAIQKLNEFAIFPLSFGYQIPIPAQKKNHFQKKLLETEILLTKSHFDKTLLRIEAEIGNLYLDYLLKQSEIELLKESLEELKRLYQIQKKLFQNGFEASTDLSNIEISTGQLNIQLFFAENDLKKLHLNLGEKIRVKEFKLKEWEEIEFFKIPVEFSSLDKIYSLEKLHLEKNINLKKRMASMEWGPSLGVHFTIGINNSNANFKELFNRLQGQQTAGINFSIPIINSGLKNKKIELIEFENENEILKMELEYENSKLRWTELKNLFQTIQNAIDVAEESLKTAEKNFKNKFELYQEGEISWLELNQALLLRNSLKNEKMGLQANLFKIYFELNQLQWTP